MQLSQDLCDQIDDLNSEEHVQELYGAFKTFLAGEGTVHVFAEISTWQLVQVFTAQGCLYFAIESEFDTVELVGFQVLKSQTH